jgi:hypothetical protein
MFHSGDSNPMDLDKLAQRVIRPLVKSVGLDWYRWHGFRLGASRRICMNWARTRKSCILRHAKPHVTKERYIKAFDPAVLAAMKSLETTLDTLNQCSANAQQVN